MDSKAAAPDVRGDPAAPGATVPEPASYSTAALLAACERSRADGRHLDGAAQAEQVLATFGIAPGDEAQARELLSLHRLRLGDVEASVRHGLLALEYLVDTGELLRQSQLHCTLALAFHETGLHEPALRHVLGALAAARASGSRLAEFWALSRSSMVHVGTGDSPRALELGRQALALSNELDDAEARFAGLNNLGDTCLEFAVAQRVLGLDPAEALAEALDNVQQAAALANGQGHTFWETIARTNLANILIELGRYDEAREQVELSRSLATANGYRNLRLDNEVQLAEIVRSEGRIDEATAMMVAQLGSPFVEDDPARLTRLHRALVQMCKESGRFELALGHSEALHALTLRLTTQTAGLQSRMLINTLEIEHARHETERSQLEAQVLRIRAEKLDHQAHTDPLTMLPNRRALERQLPALMRRAKDRAQPLCAAMVDLDHFKRVNDAHGHATGDRVLAEMGTILTAAIRDSDLAVRLGGEEFLLVFGDATPGAATKACERLLEAVRSFTWDEIGPGLVCTVSIGLAVRNAGERTAHWLARADSALYQAKSAGRDRVAMAPQ
ncbi:tetratricopeptide repeat-containing diguanylate cyclase [Cryobacterium zhongshanensis]|uniref:GGDEF domain-containing protein n=1 Tax=Cryobacterium zhongshanensis TaxID=2928153 RepID=A0AA41QUC5_9MICO|nr:GGDEF domain-containing protein [Cryobacterium zhongshanensis]MCI4656869.1 GGDEF domain-containing protein [Cryobacterium zhongshanensis]